MESECSCKFEPKCWHKGMCKTKLKIVERPICFIDAEAAEKRGYLFTKPVKI